MTPVTHDIIIVLSISVLFSTAILAFACIAVRVIRIWDLALSLRLISRFIQSEGTLSLQQPSLNETLTLYTTLSPCPSVLAITSKRDSGQGPCKTNSVDQVSIPLH